MPIRRRHGRRPAGRTAVNIPIRARAAILASYAEDEPVRLRRFRVDESVVVAVGEVDADKPNIVVIWGTTSGSRT
jgi:hypothetical protein